MAGKPWAARLSVLVGALVACASLLAIPAVAAPPAFGVPASCSGDAGRAINVLHAGSLTNLVKDLASAFHAACGATVTDQGGPAVGLADKIKSGSLAGDVYMSADANVNKTLIGPANGDWVRWYLAFARNEIVILYTPSSPFFAELEKARLGQIPWYQVLMEPGFVIGRADPNTDPGGYYALFVAGLAERYYGIPNLKQTLLGSDTNPNEVVVPPGTKTVSGLPVDALFAYRSNAVDLGLPYISLPPPINLSQPRLARYYAQVSFTNTDGVTFRGGPIYDSVTVLQRSHSPQTAIDFVRLLLSPQGRQFVQARGFLPTPLLVGGDIFAVPHELLPFIRGCYQYCGLASSLTDAGPLTDLDSALPALDQ